MSGKQQTPLVSLAVMLALATTSAPITANYLARPALGQSSNSTSFLIPKELPRGKSLQIDGSTSMIKINEALEKNFETKYPGTIIKFFYLGTDVALEALREGKFDLASIFQQGGFTLGTNNQIIAEDSTETVIDDAIDSTVTASSPAAKLKVGGRTVATDKSKDKLLPWLWLLLLPLVGGLLWWLLKDRGGGSSAPAVVRSTHVKVPANQPTDSSIPTTAAVTAVAAGTELADPLIQEETPETPVPQESRLNLVPRDSQTADASWEISPEKHAEVKDNEISATTTNTNIVGAVTTAGAAIAGAASLANQPTLTTISKVSLVVRDWKNIDVCWEISPEQQAEWQKTGKNLLLRVYDITGIDFNQKSANSFQQYQCNPQSDRLRIVIPQSDRDYVAELGYITDDGRWLKLGRSASLRIISPPTKKLSNPSAVQ